LKCAGYLLSLNDHASRVEISILLERNPVILFGKHLIAGRGIDRPGSIQIRSQCWGRMSYEKYQQHPWIKGSHQSLLSKHRAQYESLRLNARPFGHARNHSDRPHHEQSQMITNASGRPIPTAPPITIANAKSKPVAACHDMLPLLCGSRRHARMTDQSLSSRSPVKSARLEIQDRGFW
jgi:hypothetical protein